MFQAISDEAIYRAQEDASRWEMAGIVARTLKEFGSEFRTGQDSAVPRHDEPPAHSSLTCGVIYCPVRSGVVMPIETSGRRRCACAPGGNSQRRHSPFRTIAACFPTLAALNGYHPGCGVPNVTTTPR